MTLSADDSIRVVEYLRQNGALEDDLLKVILQEAPTKDDYAFAKMLYDYLEEANTDYDPVKWLQATKTVKLMVGITSGENQDRAVSTALATLSKFAEIEEALPRGFKLACILRGWIQIPTS